MAGAETDSEGVRVQTADWPVILVEFPENRLHDEALKSGLLCLEDLLKGAWAKGQKTYTVTDLTRMREFAPANQRQYAADWMSRTVGLQKAVSLGGASVTPSTILRGLVTAIYWIQPPPMPAVFVATRREAYLEALKAFDAAGVTLLPELRARLSLR